MPSLPPIFDTIPELGAVKLRATCLYPFLHLRERFEALAIVVVFSSFLAGNSGPHAKIWCAIAHRCHHVSPGKTKQKKYKSGGIQKRRTGAETKLGTRDGTLGGKRNSAPYGMRLAGSARRPKPGEHGLPAKAFRLERAPLPRTDSALAPRGLHGT
jgi:hypothetical protein